MEITIDCGLIESKAGFHKVVAKALDFPAWYGKNLDALYDCLTGVPDEMEIRFQNWEIMAIKLEGYAAVAKKVILRAASENPHVAVSFL